MKNCAVAIETELMKKITEISATKEVSEQDTAVRETEGTQDKFSKLPTKSKYDDHTFDAAL